MTFPLLDARSFTKRQTTNCAKRPLQRRYICDDDAMAISVRTKSGLAATISKITHTHTPYLSRRRPPGFAISRALGAPNEWSQLGTIRKHEMSVYFFNSCAQRRTRRTRLPRRSHTPIITNSSSRASSPTKSFNHLLLRHRSDYVCGIDFSPSRPLRSRDIRTSPSLDPF